MNMTGDCVFIYPKLRQQLSMLHFVLLKAKFWVSGKAECIETDPNICIYVCDNVCWNAL